MIANDLSNENHPLFSMCSYDKDDFDNYNASDNFFFPEQKKYRINDGFIGLMKNKVLAYKQEKTTFFTEDEIYESQVKEMENKIADIASQIKAMYKSGLNTIQEWSNVSAITSPICISKGAYVNSNVAFMHNPLGAKYDSWLTSDVDLYTLHQHPIYNIQ